ncbi:MAG: hypothetical protein IPM12_09290 [Flavobacteriales bacterium]|nr:hypothetical protein [Flavobacteriales bacterium]
MVTGTNGCTSTATAEVEQDTDAPGAQAAGGTITCGNTCVMLTGTGNGSFAWSGPNNFSSTEQNPTVCAPGTYTLVVTGTNGCTSTATAEVEQDTDAPGAQAAGGTITCGNECVMLTGTGNGSFAWSGPNNFSSTEQNPTVCAPGTYTLVVTGTNGCTSTATAEVEQDTDAPGAQAAGGTITCGNECVMLTGTGNGSFAWSGPNNFSSTEQNPTVCAPGTYTLVVTGTNGCTSTATAEVEQDTDAPGAQAAGGTITCGNECVMLTGTGNGSFAWSGPNNFSSTEQNPTVCAPGTYTLVVTGTNGCTSTATAEVEQDTDAPGAQAAGGTITCGNECVMLTGTGNGSFAWSGPNNFSSTEQNPTVCAPGTYTLVVTGTNGCTSTATAEVEQDTDAPGAQAAGGTITCGNECVMLTGTGNGSFAWSGPNNFSSTEQNPTVCAPGTYTLVVTGTNGCTSTATAEVEQDTDAPGAQAAGGTITCGNTCVMLTGTGNGSFAWSGPNNFSSTEQNPTVCAPGTYTLVVTGTNGCTSTATAEVEQDTDAPGAQAAGGTITCGNECVMLTGTGNGSFAWSGPNNFSSTEQNPTVCAPGTYTLVVTGTNGCTSTATAEVEQDTDAPGAQAAGGTITCGNECVMLTGTGNGSFAWSGPNNFSSTEQNPTVCAPGTYTLVVTGTNGCTSTATAEVEQDTDAPGAQAAGGTITCGNECVMLTGTGNGSFAWSGPNNFSSTEQNPTVCAPGTYTLVVTGTNGCTSTATTQVGSDVEAPQATLSSTLIGCDGEPAVVSYNSNSAIASAEWFNTSGLVGSGNSISTTDPGAYTLILTGVNGCTNEFSIEVQQNTDCDKDCDPLILECPADITVACADDFSPFGLGGEPIFNKKKDDDCPDVVQAWWSDAIISNCPYVIRRTWHAVGSDGSTETCTQYITVIDDVAPIFYNVPDGINIACDADMDAITTPDVTAYDECTKVDVAVYHNMEIVQGNCAGNYSIIHTWTSQDQCGNIGTATWTIEVIDNVPPVISCPVEDISVECKDVPEPTDKCEATDNCSAEVTITVEEEKGEQDEDGKYVITRTYIAMDECGNASTQVQLITVWCDKKEEDGKGPVQAGIKMVASAWPNPFREESSISITAQESGVVQVIITDLQGRVVSELYNGHVEAGAMVVLPFRPAERNGGAYLYRVRLNGEELMGRLLAQP